MSQTPEKAQASPPELWGGVECTIVRVGDEYRDQTAETGHDIRRDDIDRIADLGVTTVRYPILWESVAPESTEDCDFAWTDERLAEIRDGASWSAAVFRVAWASRPVTVGRFEPRPGSAVGCRP